MYVLASRNVSFRAQLTTRFEHFALENTESIPIPRVPKLRPDEEKNPGFFYHPFTAWFTLTQGTVPVEAWSIVLDLEPEFGSQKYGSSRQEQSLKYNDQQKHVAFSFVYHPNGDPLDPKTSFFKKTIVRATKKNLALLSMTYWLVNRDPYNGL